uniref:PAP2_C domain-containing protein n=1 Tax=Onchocerca volvulus TaxID=6282 RepID=A0A8R1TYR3_ONCVO
MLPVVEKSFFIFHLQLTQEEKKNSEAYEEEEEKEEEKEYGNGKFTRYLIMNVTGGRVELRKLLFVLTFLTLAAFGNWIALAYIHDFVGREALPDIVFSVVPELLWTLKVGDAMVTLCSTFFFTLLFLHKNRLIIIQRIAFIVACLYTMRTISLLCTQLPPGYIDNNKRCRNQSNRTGQKWDIIAWRVFSQAVKLGFQDMDDEMLCGDLLFSGHTLAMVISSLTIAYYLPESFRPLRYIPRLLSWIGMICMVISRTHYTIDVLFAYWLSTAVFSIYHAFCEIDLTNRKLSILYRLWVVQIVGWLEVDITPGRLIENRFEFPFLIRLYKWWSSPSKNHYSTQNNNCHHQKQQQVSVSSALPI